MKKFIFIFCFFVSSLAIAEQGKVCKYELTFHNNVFGNGEITTSTSEGEKWSTWGKTQSYELCNEYIGELVEAYNKAGDTVLEVRIKRGLRREFIDLRGHKEDNKAPVVAKYSPFLPFSYDLPVQTRQCQAHFRVKSKNGEVVSVDQRPIVIEGFEVFTAAKCQQIALSLVDEHLEQYNDDIERTYYIDSVKTLYEDGGLRYFGETDIYNDVNPNHPVEDYTSYIPYEFDPLEAYTCKGRIEIALGSSLLRNNNPYLTDAKIISSDFYYTASLEDGMDLLRCQEMASLKGKAHLSELKSVYFEYIMLGSKTKIEVLVK